MTKRVIVAKGSFIDVVHTRSGRSWHWELFDKKLRRSSSLNLSEAVDYAFRIDLSRGKVLLNTPGGKHFDSMYRARYQLRLVGSAA